MTRNWIFDKFLCIAIKQHEKDSQLCEILQSAIYHNGLQLELIRARHSTKADTILEVLIETALAIVSNETPLLADLESQGRLMFLEAINDFLAKAKNLPIA